MKRINVVHGGTSYSISGRDLDDVQNEITAVLNTAEPYWLVVNHGEGVPRQARLLITPGVDFALVPAPEPEQGPELFTDQPAPPPAR